MKKLRVKLLKGSSHDIVGANVKSLKDAGYSHKHAMHFALKHAAKIKPMESTDIKRVSKRVAKPQKIMRVITHNKRGF